MEARVIGIVWLLELVAIVAIFVVMPRIARRGLLFGVYVGEDGASSDAARTLKKWWYLGMAVTCVASAAAFVAAGNALGAPGAFGISSLALMAGAVATYVRVHTWARRLAVEPTVEEPDVPETAAGHGSVFPLVTLAFVVVACAVAAIHVGSAYPSLPEQIPVHFDASGTPDRWTEKSPVVIFLPVALALVLGGFMPLFGHLVIHAKRSVRGPDPRKSAAAQNRFRTATGRFLCALTYPVTGMMLWIAIGQVRVAQGRSESLGTGVLGLGLLTAVIAFGGVIYLLARYGQGGARLEGGGELTDGLADNRFWKWGVFYINPDDPAIMVEKRFGLGYTINFGNRKAVALLVGFLVLLFALVALAIVAT